jgi:hypothetical protein
MIPLKDTGIEFDIVRYKYMKMRPKELVAAFKMIMLFEQLISQFINEEDFESKKEKQIKSHV